MLLGGCEWVLWVTHRIESREIHVQGASRHLGPKFEIEIEEADPLLEVVFPDLEVSLCY